MYIDISYNFTPKKNVNRANMITNKRYQPQLTQFLVTRSVVHFQELSVAIAKEVNLDFQFTCKYTITSVFEILTIHLFSISE